MPKKLGKQTLSHCSKCHLGVRNSCIAYHIITPTHPVYDPICKHCQYAKFDFNVYHKVSDLNGTLYVTIRNTFAKESSWRDGNIFVKEESLGVIAPIIDQFIPNFWISGHYKMYQYISRQEVISLVCYLEDLVKGDGTALQKAAQISTGAFKTYQSDIIRMIQKLSESLSDLCEDYEMIEFGGI
ncbi:MAG: hypothetical protein AAFP82_16280 [Bacteroidota bacterium]